VLALLDHLNLERVHLAGHSMGGLVSLTVASQAPERVASLVLIASAGLGADINGDYLQGFTEANNRNALKPQLVQLFSDPALVTRQMLEDMLKFKRLEGVDQALRQLNAKLFDGGRQMLDLRAVVGQQPSLVIWGSDDAIIPVRHAQGLQAQVEVLPGQGHMVQLEAAEQVNQLLSLFLKSQA
jgi:pyruvate dehydrogenase E2 component (dihydrolipoamide acetyltransferase)